MCFSPPQRWVRSTVQWGRQCRCSAAETGTPNESRREPSAWSPCWMLPRPTCRGCLNAASQVRPGDCGARLKPAERVKEEGKFQYKSSPVRSQVPSSLLSEKSAAAGLKRQESLIWGFFLFQKCSVSVCFWECLNAAEYSSDYKSVQCCTDTLIDYAL